MTTKTSVYRDATYSRETQETLRDLLAHITSQPLWLQKHGQHAQALADVIERWDANDATEYKS